LTSLGTPILIDPPEPGHQLDHATQQWRAMGQLTGESPAHSAHQLT